MPPSVPDFYSYPGLPPVFGPACNRTQNVPFPCGRLLLILPEADLLLTVHPIRKDIFLYDGFL